MGLGWFVATRFVATRIRTRFRTRIRTRTRSWSGLVVTLDVANFVATEDLGVLVAHFAVAAVTGSVATVNARRAAM